MTQLVEFVDDRVRLNLHSGQTLAWDSTKRFIMVIAGTQGGKTSFGPWWLQREIDLRGPGDYIAVTSTYDLFKLKMLPGILEVFEHILGIGRHWAGDNVVELMNPETGQFQAKRSTDPMWARIILRSARSPGGLESATAKGAWADELGQDEFPLLSWEALLRRLALARGRVLGTTTPYNLGWLKQQLYDPWKQGDPTIDVIQFKSIVNPSFPKEEYEERKRRMPSWKFRMFYDGQFERPAGLIYSSFNDFLRDEQPGGHKVRPFNLPRIWPRWVGVDPGSVNQAKVWLAYDFDRGIYYLYRELVEGDMSTAQHVQKVVEIERSLGENTLGYFVGNKSESQQRMDWEEQGLYNVYEPPIVDVESGIDKVFELFQTHRLFIFETCTQTLDQLSTYRRKLDENNNPTEVILNKEQYHLLDALRYVVVGTELSPTLRTEVATSRMGNYRGR